MIFKIGGKTREMMEVLGIAEYPFTPEEITSRFRKLIKESHKDVNPNADESESKRLIEAYKNLKNLAIAVADDNTRSVAFSAYEKDKSDMFALWKTCPNCHGAGNFPHKQYVDHRELCPRCSSNFKAWRRTKGIRQFKCSDCNGTGKFMLRSGNEVDCRTCKGTGTIKWTCPDCGGSGYTKESMARPREITIHNPCYSCSGLGKVKINPFSAVIKKGAVLI
jgi:DnaJ-class molecular chaperone